MVQPPAPWIINWVALSGGICLGPDPGVSVPSPGVWTELESWFRPESGEGGGPWCLGWACLAAGSYYWVGCYRGPVGSGPEHRIPVSVAGWALDDRGETFDPGVYLGGLAPFPFRV
jgi:hypothetical protein